MYLVLLQLSSFHVSRKIKRETIVHCQIYETIKTQLDGQSPEKGDRLVECIQKGVRPYIQTQSQRFKV